MRRQKLYECSLCHKGTDVTLAIPDAPHLHICQRHLDATTPLQRFLLARGYLPVDLGAGRKGMASALFPQVIVTDGENFPTLDVGEVRIITPLGVEAEYSFDGRGQLIEVLKLAEMKTVTEGVPQ